MKRGIYIIWSYNNEGIRKELNIRDLNDIIDYSFIHLQSIDPVYSNNRQQAVELVKKVYSVAI